MKVAVITGAASGIGLALSHVCLQRGMKIAMVDKDKIKLQHEAQQLAIQYPEHVLHVSCDITRSDEISQLLSVVDEWSGQVDWIFNNAGIMGTLAPVWELQSEQIKQVMEVNLFGMIEVIKVFMPYLLKQSTNAHIINMASLYGLCSGSQMASYSMSKHAVLALSESLHFDLKRLDISVDVSVVFPSFTDTSLLANKSSESNSVLHDSLNTLLSHSRPAIDVATHIVNEVEQKRFYILPDKEVKGYCEERTNAIVHQEEPHINNIEKLVSSLIKRKRTLV